MKNSNPDLPAGLPAALEGEAGVSRRKLLRGGKFLDTIAIDGG